MLRTGARKKEAMRSKVKIVGLFAFVALLAGCAGSFEEAKLAGMNPQAKAAAAPPSSECRALDSNHRTWDAIAKGAAVLAGAQGLGQIPSDSKEARIGLAAGTAVAATGAVVAETLASGYATSWARDCQ